MVPWTKYEPVLEFARGVERHHRMCNVCDIWVESGASEPIRKSCISARGSNKARTPHASVDQVEERSVSRSLWVVYVTLIVHRKHNKVLSRP